MAQEKSVKLNKGRVEEFLKATDEKASGRAAFVYQAIIVSLIIHIFILFVTQMLTQDNRMVREQEIMMPLDMDMIEEQALETEDVPLEEESSQRSEELRNLVANELSQRSTEQKSYRGMSKEQINQQVYDDLKNMEAEEFAKLKDGRPDDYSVNNKTQGASSDKPSTKKPNDYDWYKDKKNHNTSYNGSVTASYSMGSRSNLRQPTPTYRCKTPGKVVMNVTINNLGVVSDLKIDESKSSVDECLRTESEKYGRQWKFDAPANAPRKQDGTITFTFSAQ